MVHGLGLEVVRAGGFGLALTPETLVTLLAGLLAILFDWFPGLAPWFDGLSAVHKRQVMAGLLAVLGVGLFAGSCWGWFESGLACAPEHLPELLQVILVAVGVNQAAHLLAKP